ncbi:MAG: glycosyltransferase, partial [Patescibacteria group bacterium]
MRKKLLFIITKSEMGGAQRFLYELITHLEPEKYDITVAAGDPPIGRGELFYKLNEKNIKTTKIGNFSNAAGIKNILAFFEIFSVIKKEKPDTVYLLSSEAGFSGSIAAFIYRFGRKKPKIIYRIGGWAFKEPRNIIIKKIYLWAEKLSAPFKD